MWLLTRSFGQGIPIQNLKTKTIKNEFKQNGEKLMKQGIKQRI